MKKRENMFFGIHFDFHAQKGEVIGEDFRPEVVAELLDRVKPDFVQCDTKGHFGYSSYPTKIGVHGEIKNDVLKMWRTLTKERDIALYGHHSGLFDMTAAQKHPEWAIVDEDGNVSKDYLSPFSPYAAEYLVPQLKELAIDYELDGAWIDGECWATYVDYSKYAVDTYKKEFGKVPPKSTDEDFESYKEFCKKGFNNYVRCYVKAIKEIRPDFEITSNWIYSGYMPEIATVEVDFLSGDYLPFNSVESARHNARCLLARNKTWDLLAWGQSAVPPSFETRNRSTKEYEQYCQEAAEVIALGGGFQFFNIMYGGGGTVQPWAIPMWEKVAKFCRERKYCHKAKPVHQVGVVFGNSKLADKKKIYDMNLKSFEDTCSWNNALLDSGFSTEFVFDSENVNLNDYPVLILPYATDINKEKYISYAEKGGHLIVDLDSVEYFEEIKDIQEKLIFIEGDETLAATEVRVGEICGDFEICGKAYMDNYFKGEAVPCALQKKAGKGTITFMCMDFATAYKENVTSTIKTFLKKIVSATGFRPLVEINGSSFTELILTEKDDKLHINIFNTAGQSGLMNVRGYNEVPKIGPLKVKVHKPDAAKITKMPESEKIEFNKKDNYVEFEFDSVHIHTTAILEE